MLLPLKGNSKTIHNSKLTYTPSRNHFHMLASRTNYLDHTLKTMAWHFTISPAIQSSLFQLMIILLMVLVFG